MHAIVKVSATEREMADIIIIMHREGIILDGQAREYNDNGWHPYEALLMSQGTAYETEMTTKYWEHIDSGLNMLQTPENSITHAIKTKRITLRRNLIRKPKKVLTRLKPRKNYVTNAQQ